MQAIIIGFFFNVMALQILGDHRSPHIPFICKLSWFPRTMNPVNPCTLLNSEFFFLQTDCQICLESTFYTDIYLYTGCLSLFSVNCLEILGKQWNESLMYHAQFWISSSSCSTLAATQCRGAQSTSLLSDRRENNIMIERILIKSILETHWQEEECFPPYLGSIDFPSVA